jgi:RNA polymerase sigma-B factor
MLVRRFLPLARTCARRYASPSAPYEDLAQVASLGLVNAIDRFDPNRGTSFQAFATPTIVGEIKRYFRDAVWTVHVARAAKERALKVDRATDLLRARLGRSPTVRDIGRHLDLEDADVLDALQVAQAYTAISLDQPRPIDGGEEEIVEGQLGAEDERYELVEDASAVREAMSALPRCDVLLLRLRFGNELSQREIGARLGISQMQVSRLLRRALARLRALAAGKERRDAPALDRAQTPDYRPRPGEIDACRNGGYVTT